MTATEILVAALVYLMLVLAGDVESNPGPILSDRPKIHELSIIRKDDNKLSVTDWITSHEMWKCVDFANILLRDDVLIRRHQNNCKEKDEFVRVVLRDWLSRDDGDTTDSAVPRTWSALAECVSDAGLDGALAKAIRDTLSSDMTSSPGHIDSLHLPSSSSQNDSILTIYKKYLQDLYSAEYPGYLKQQFTVNRPKQIVNLVLVHKEKNEGDKLQRECLLYQLHGNIDLIQQKKTPLTKDQITVLDSEAGPATVLIEGAPGIGKTTLLWQLCHQWADGQLLQQWELVILVQLRDETTRTAQCLSDLLYHPDNDINKAICRIVKRQEGENVLFIFDGYDELYNDQRADSIILNILRRQFRSLRKAAVVVSSRPFATKVLPHQFKCSINQHVEIVGFNQNDIETYLTSACQGNPKILRDLKSYISTQAFISSVLYNPLHCTIVTELYLQYWQRGEKGFAPSTLTQLYEALVLNLLRRHLDNDIDDLSELPSDVSHQLNQLGELAARGIEQRKYIFDNVPCDTLGLMHSVKQLHDCRAKRLSSHSFTHLTLQEFLGGRYWSQLPPKKLTELLQQPNLFPIEDYLKGMHREQNEESLRVTHWPVLLFLAGLTTIPTELITPWTDRDESTTCYVEPSLCHLLFESQSPRLVSTVFHGRRLKPSTWYMIPSPLDWFAIGYCIAHSDTTSSWSVVFCESPQCLQAFSSGVHYSDRDIGLLTAMTSNCKLPSHHLQQCIPLKRLYLRGPDGEENEEENEEFDHESEPLNITSFLTSISPLLVGQLEYLKLELVSIDSEACVKALIHLLTPPHSSLHELILTKLTISSSDYCQLTTSIATSNLTCFITKCCHFDILAAKGLAAALKHSKTLETVEICEDPLIIESARILVEAMNHSRVKRLLIGHVAKDSILGCSYPIDRVILNYVNSKSFW